MAIDAGGAYAERIAVHERQLMRVPAAVGLDDAAAIPEVFLTAWDALVVQGGLTSGRWALVHAGASGVGTAAIQIAKAIGARIVVTCSAGKVDACRALGADVVVDYGSEDFVDEVRTRHRWQRRRRRPRRDRRRLRRPQHAVVRIGGRILQVGMMGGGSDVGERRRAAAASGSALIGTVLRPARSRRRSRSPDASPPRCCRCSTTDRCGR